MYLQKLELNGFKSFAKKTSLEFTRGTTAIVGPNGSGKSNIAESIRWVMGEQSLKSLRGKKSTDVIFSGSDKVSRLGLAEVSLYFDNSGSSVGSGQTDIEFSEIIITRKVSRDGHGEYFINNQPTRLHDILLLLAQINLSSKTYSVVGQGMVDIILSITSTERKEFFEEASGVKPLQMKKNESTRKLDATEENLQTLEIQLNEITPRLRSLTRQVKRLEQRVELENKLFDLQYHYFGETLYGLKHKSEKFKADKEQQTKNINTLDNKIKALQKHMFALTKESSHSDQFAKLQLEHQGLFEKKSALKERELKLKASLLQTVKHSEKTHVSIHLVKEVYAKWLVLKKELKQLHARSRTIQDTKDALLWQKYMARLIKNSEELFDSVQPYITPRKLDFKSDQEAKELTNKVEAIDERLKYIQIKITELTKQEKKEKESIWETQNTLQARQQELNNMVTKKNEVLVSLARIETRIGDIELEIVQDAGVEFLNRVQKWAPHDKKNEDSDVEIICQEIHKLKHQLELVGGIDPEVIKEYEEIKERHEFLDTQSKDLTETIKNLHQVIDELDETIKKQFIESFNLINTEFQKFFKILFSGGKAELKLVKWAEEIKNSIVDEKKEDEDEQPMIVETVANRNKKDEIMGVEISATPPGKKLKSIHMLSGGERALTSIALICAIISNNPAPFVVLDEVDAALDEANSLRFAEILEELSHKTQFIVVTHNRATMEKAEILYGLTMGDDGISKLLSLKLDAAQQYTNRQKK